MPNLNKTLMTVGGVAAGVIIAGYIMSTFKDVGFIQTARDGFDTGLL